MQAKRVRQDFSITEAAWNVRRELIRANILLKRHGLILPEPSGEPARLRFEAEAPNDLWQMEGMSRTLLKLPRLASLVKSYAASARRSTPGVAV